MPTPATRPLKVGLLLPIIEGTMAGGSAGWRELLAFARHAEALGFDSLWIPDHLIFRLGRWPGDQVGTWEAWSVLAGLAAATERITLGTYVNAVGFRNPALLAKMAVTVDEISGGRFILGLGAGWHQAEFDAFGMPFDHRLGRFEEAFTIIRSLIGEGHVDFSGRYHTARDAELRPWGPRQGKLPIMLGSNGPRTLRIALPHVQLWNSDWTHRPDEIPPLRARVDEACADVGRDPSAVERTAGVVYDLPIRRPGRDGRASTRGATAPGVDASTPMTGTHEEIATHLRGYAAEGIERAICWIDPADEHGLDWFARVLELVSRP
ncbi:MAG: LLM class flavin-dependent oxidoreductase [Chloroflexota bacterium]